MIVILIKILIMEVKKFDYNCISIVELENLKVCKICILIIFKKNE